MKSAPKPGASVELERSAEVVEVQITDEEFPELSALVDEALAEIEAGKTRPWP